MAWGLGTLADLGEDPGLVPSIHMVSLLLFQSRNYKEGFWGRDFWQEDHGGSEKEGGGIWTLVDGFSLESRKFWPA